MPNLLIGLIILSGVAFVIAVIGALFDLSVLGVTPEGYSRACNNFALIAIALSVCIKREREKT
jgi:hypothetical protein